VGLSVVVVARIGFELGGLGKCTNCQFGVVVAGLVVAVIGVVVACEAIRIARSAVSFTSRAWSAAVVILKFLKGFLMWRVAKSSPPVVACATHASFPDMTFQSALTRSFVL
jgi:hypothetical protein